MLAALHRFAGQANQVEQRAPRGSAALDRSLNDAHHAQPEDQAPSYERAARARGADFVILPRKTEQRVDIIMRRCRGKVLSYLLTRLTCDRQVDCF